MNTRLGSILYGAGLAGAAIAVLYVVDAIWVFKSGRSLLPISGRFLTRQDMLTTIAIGTALALLLWGAGAAARYFVNKSAEKSAGAKHRGKGES